MVNLGYFEPGVLRERNTCETLELLVEIPELGPLFVANIRECVSCVLSHIIIHHPIKTVTSLNVPVFAQYCIVKRLSHR